ncbi:MAG: hypothetical protein NWF00_11190 [Candidatus Bathyarchaeota archaeon]|nr:hypothetical protein [Candidatus Bathyarchaeota archaeon]
MPQDQERIKAVVAFKQRLENRLAKLEEEAQELQATLDAVNGILLEKGFKRGNLQDAEAAEATKEAASQPTQERAPTESRPTGYQGGEPENVIPLKTANDESLALIYVENDKSVHVLPDESKQFSVNTPPFSNFLVERVLVKMQNKDSELVRLNQLTPEQMFSYNIVREGDLIREIVLRNVDEERLKELKSSIRWTLDKMYEKMKIQQQ